MLVQKTINSAWPYILLLYHIAVPSDFDNHSCTDCIKQADSLLLPVPGKKPYCDNTVIVTKGVVTSVLDNTLCYNNKV